MRGASQGPWYGDGSLWASTGGLDHAGVVALRHQRDGYHWKFPWFTLEDGSLVAEHPAPEIRSTRVDKSETATVEGPDAGFAQPEGTPFWAQVIGFPSPGCWTVTATRGSAMVRFTVRVERAAQ